MKLKSTKSKVLAGAMAVGLIATSGAALASTDAGAKLQAWYDGQFNTAETGVESFATNYVNKLVPGAQSELNNGLAEVESQIGAKGTAETKNATDAIGDAKTAYIEDVNTQKASISEGIEAQFNSILSEADSAINAAGTVVYDYAEGEFGKAATDAGTDALSSVESSINAAKDTAKSELQAAIDKAKGDLLVELNEERRLTQVEIKEKIDGKISELKSQLGTLVVGLIGDQKELIAEKASKLEGDALAELDTVANGI